MLAVILKLAIATFVGLILGIEREAKHKPLGIKTCVVISVASCLLTIVSIQAAFDSHGGEYFIRADPMRLAAQIISGVGFLGAGVILRRNNDVISGLTTAAIVWAASGFGIAVGAGYFYEVFIGLILIILSIKLLPYMLRKYGPSSLREQEMQVSILVDEDLDMYEFMMKIEKIVIDIKDTHIKSTDGGKRILLRCTVNDEPQILFEQYHLMSRLTGVQQIEIKGM
ncbi:MAG TPA: MgtC/SapB family protein [Pseudogracilibacillus sp.]|nr:MgtC/SapB family protein [Pseudogracilibacillus sp.]